VSLPTPWIDRIFDKLTLTYGQSFLRRWADIDMNAVKSDWGHELAGFEQHPRAIAWALQNLPVDHPPTVLEFRSLARKAPPTEAPRLESPKADPSRVAAELAKLAPVLKDRPRLDGRAWARAILARSEAGERVNPTTLRFAREAIANREVA
jgi:hypothetical protein